MPASAFAFADCQALVEKLRAELELEVLPCGKEVLEPAPLPHFRDPLLFRSCSSCFSLPALMLSLLPSSVSGVKRNSFERQESEDG